MAPRPSKPHGDKGAEQESPTFFEARRMKETAFPFSVFVGFVTFAFVTQVASSGVALVAMILASSFTQVALVKSAMKPFPRQRRAGKTSEHPAE